MDLTQQSVLSFLVEEGGKVKKSELVRRFKGSIDRGDPAERERNRELFKDFVNNVAVVKQIDEARFVVVRKQYEPLVESFQAQGRSVGKNEDVDVPLQGELQRPPAQSEDGDDSNEGRENPTELLNPIQLALQRCKYDCKVKRGLNFEVQNEPKETACVPSKPFGLPLRMPPTKMEIHKLKIDDMPESPKLEASRNKRRPPSVETGSSVGSLNLRRFTKTTKAPAELKENRSPSVVPLEQSEHKWLVKCAAGHWSQVYGLLMKDSQLAEKKDFTSGFTALHWTAKCGNSEMLVKIIDLSKKGGVELNINTKTFGGYTPLHIAALHDQEYIMAMLVGEYGADPTIRDNCGRRAYHYLHKGVSHTIRDMLGQPKVPKVQDTQVKMVQHEKEELDGFPDRPKGLQSISKLFQPNLTGQKKKHKQRPGLYSLSDERDVEERDEGSGFRHRPMSDVFMEKP